MNIQNIESKYENLLGTIFEVYENGKIRAFSAVNTELVQKSRQCLEN